MVVGTRAQVFHGTADQTSGGLTADDLMLSKSGEIVSKAKHALAMKKSNPLRKFITKAKKSAGKDFKKMPKVGTKEYKKLTK
jgi:hypothetical protein